MTGLLIHSVSEFSDLILEALRLADAQNIVEIGAEYGGMSALLADHCRARGGQLTSVDPAPKREFLDWVDANPDVRHVAKTSLDAFGELDAADAWIVDGDHNWYTVYHELREIEAISRRAAKPLLVFLHDVGWPCGRRDAYYAPDQIPAEHRHTHSYDAGAALDRESLVEGRGFRGMGQFAFATHAGGVRNGVMTAIDDFLAEELAQGREFGFAEIPAVFGLGVLFDMNAAWSAQLAELVLPYHQNKLLRALETNRLRNYLRVIDMQDEFAARPGAA
ncbi:class I SAM-dependent methyltransferase [Bradyrhizobium quebecense]|uniref:Class I SAM-dependent methyltransferase n=1 Tax=Bradyrhizobium quebecense TaxID=2748629 RepID=A0A974ACW3_9BRAD|nr:class I SAM-dependent methyltransferase [Bradyrhizobium quebecense]UGA41139.1 class I SAM-dependent methyltransferase [Bradyrhizobium quebecense]